MNAWPLDEWEAPTPLPLTWMRRLLDAIDHDAPAGAAETLEQLESALRTLAQRSLDRAGCRAFLREHGVLLVRYFRLVSALIDRFGAPDPDAIVDEWSDLAAVGEGDDAVRKALRRSKDCLIETDAGTHGAELRTALEAALVAFGSQSPLDALLSLRAELVVAILAGVHAPPGQEAAYGRLLDELCDGHDDAELRSLDHLYLRLGRWKAPGFPPAHERALWHLFGGGGVRFLLERLLAEQDADRLDAASEVLIALWPLSSGGVRAALEASLKHGDGDVRLTTLLKSLRWVRRDVLKLPMDQALFTGLLREAMAHGDADAREAAVRALVSWQGPEAAEVLRRRLPFERDTDVREVILELLADTAHESAA